MQKHIIYLFLFVFLLFGCSSQKDKIVLLPRGEVYVADSHGLQIVFPDRSLSSLGVSPILFDRERMELESFEQAVVFATKLKRNYSIFRMANLDRDDSGDFAMFLVNVFESLDLKQFYFERLVSIHQVDFAGYRISFYDYQPQSRPINVINLFQLPSDFQAIPARVDGHFIKSSGLASSSSLDFALDRAFEMALTELSKFQLKQVINTSLVAENFIESATVVEAENIVDDVMFSEIKLFLSFHLNLPSYVVFVELKRDTRQTVPIPLDFGQDISEFESLEEMDFGVPNAETTSDTTIGERKPNHDSQSKKDSISPTIRIKNTILREVETQ